MRASRAALGVVAVVAAGAILLSGGSDSDPSTPPALPGLPPPFLGTAVSGDGRMTAAVDAYGDVVNLYAPGPAGHAEIANSSARQAAGTVPSDTGIVPRVRVGDGPALPLWRAESVRQSYVPGTSAVRTVASFEGGTKATETVVARGEELAVLVGVSQAGRGGAGTMRADSGVRASLGVNLEAGVECREGRPRHGQDLIALLCGQNGRDGGGVGGRDRPGIGSGVDAGAVSSGSGGDGAAAGSANPGGDMDAGLNAPEEGRHDAAAVYAATAKVALLGAAADRRWLARARPLGAGAPAWARAMYGRSLLTLRALTGRDGAAAAGAREGWAYVWPRDAASAALALETAGYPGQARRVARFLSSLSLATAARFDEAGAPIPGRGPQGDEAGWVAAAERATGFPGSATTSASGAAGSPRWRDLPDYQEGAPGDYLGNAIAAAGTLRSGGPTPSTGRSASQPPSRAIAAAAIGEEFGTPRGLVRQAGDPASGLDSAAAWAVRPFALRPLYREAGKTLLRLASHATRFGITPGEGWTGGEDPWTAPTAGSAWALAALARAGEGAGPNGARHVAVDPVGAVPTPRAAADRRAALGLLADLRRAATPAGGLPERVDAQSGLPRSTTPLLWSSALTVLALRELWPNSRPRP